MLFQFDVADLLADGNELTDELTESLVLVDLFPGALDGGALGNDSSHRLAVDWAGERKLRTVSPSAFLGTMAGRFAALAETLDERTGTHRADVRQLLADLIAALLERSE